MQVDEDPCSEKKDRNSCLQSHFSSVVPVEIKGYIMRFLNLPDFKNIENVRKFQKVAFYSSFFILFCKIKMDYS